MKPPEFPREDSPWIVDDEPSLAPLKGPTRARSSNDMTAVWGLAGLLAVTAAAYAVYQATLPAVVQLPPAPSPVPPPPVVVESRPAPRAPVPRIRRPEAPRRTESSVVRVREETVTTPEVVESDPKKAFESEAAFDRPTRPEPPRRRTGTASFDNPPQGPPPRVSTFDNPPSSLGARRVGNAPNAPDPSFTPPR